MHLSPTSKSGYLSFKDKENLTYKCGLIERLCINKDIHGYKKCQ